MKIRLLAILLLLTNVIHLTGAPAIPAKPEMVPPVAALPVPQADLGGFKDLPELWSSLYFKGDWKGLQQSVMTQLQKVDDPKFDFDKNIYSVVVFTTERKKDGELIRFLIGKTVTEAFSNNLRGTDTFQEVYVTRDFGSALQSFISVTPLPDPRQAQVEGLLKALPLSAIVKFVPFSLRTVRAVPLPPQPSPVRHAVALYRAPISSQLSAIAIETFLSLDDGTYIADDDATGAVLKDKIEEKQMSLELRTARSSDCLKELNTALAKAGGDAAANFANALTGADRGVISKAIRYAYDNFTPSNPCTADDTDAMIALEQNYLTLVAAETPEPIVGEFTHDNVPLRRWNVATAGGVIVHSVSDDRGAVEDEKLVRKELRAEALVSLNLLWHPVPYDPSSSKVFSAERTRVFVGVVTTPNLGISFGVDLSIFKDFGFTAGYAHMRVDERAGTAKFGEMVPTGESGTKKGMAGGFFLGFSYKF